MKIIKKIILSFLTIMVLTLIGGYFYFDQKFTPEKNYLTVENESGKIPIKWLGHDKNVLLVPVHFSDDSATYYLQFDSGSPYTQLYSQPIKNIKAITVNKDRAKAVFYLGKAKIVSDRFKIIDIGKVYDKNDSVKIIGTLGADILENNRTLLNFKDNNIVFNLSETPLDFRNKLIDFTFKKRKIIIKGTLKGKEEKFLFDSGTSAYELLTTKEVWEELKLPGSKIVVEKSQSWQNVLTTYTAKCGSTIFFKNEKIPLNQVTYVEGFSQAQYLLMKLSGMTGMLGNKIFLKNRIYIDCSKNKIGIE